MTYELKTISDENCFVAWASSYSNPGASREHPMLLEMLGDGRLHLSGIAKLAPHRRLARPSFGTHAQ